MHQRVPVRPGRVAGCLRARSQADPVDRVLPAVMPAALRRPAQAREPLPVASLRVPWLQRVERAPQALQRQAVTQPGQRPHLRVRV